MAAPATRLLSTGELLVNGSFDENTSIAPSTFGTTSNTVYAGTLDEVSLDVGAISFNGTTQYLTVPSDTAFAFGTGDFTVESYIYFSVAPPAGGYAILDCATSGQFGFYITDTAIIAFISQSTTYSFTQSLTSGVWYHIALSRVGTTLTCYVNGTSIGTNTVSFSFTSPNTLNIGRNASSTQYLNGYLSNLRIVKGTALYTAGFATPQSALSAITGTSLLLNVIDSTNFIKDNSTNNFTVTNNGTATWNTIGPFNQGSTTLVQRQVNDGTLEVSNQFDELSLGTGAIVFNGTTQSLSVASNAAFAVGTGSFTVEFWAYPRANTSQAMFDLRNPDNVGAGFDIYVSPSGPSFRVGTSGQNYLTGAFTTLNIWYHLALSRSGSTFSLYINGTLAQTVTNTSNFTNNTPKVGSGVNGFFNGYISNFRFVKGTGLYTANFTPAQTILPAITGTSFLLNATDSANFIKDNGPNNFTATNNGTATWTAVGPFNT